MYPDPVPGGFRHHVIALQLSIREHKKERPKKGGEGGGVCIHYPGQIGRHQVQNSMLSSNII